MNLRCGAQICAAHHIGDVLRIIIYGCSKDDAQNILTNSPHTLETLTCDKWNNNYSRKEAAYPLSYVEDNKFWPSVTRIDDAFGDRNLICTCNPIEDYIES